MVANKKKLIVVVGPTAVGKTALAIRLAKYFNTEIISADSRQFYKEMSAGTAKPDSTELAQVKHHFINSHSIVQEYSAGDFERDALGLLDSLFKKHDEVIMVGGSGLFIRAVCEGFDDLPKAPEEVRESLNAIFQQKGIAPLQARVKEIDPFFFANADIQNPQRLIRAIEVFEATGRPFSDFQKRSLKDRHFQVVTVGLNMEREELYDRINRRVDLMITSGLLREVQQLIDYREKPALRTVGYAEIFDYLDGKYSFADAVALIKQNSRRYAKRQITWFKKYGNTRWFTPLDWDSIVTYIKED
ncbi:tRNA (adenosine(37)-N6)-dimethylallyltransferase MiaA [Sphingobacterium shayense]|uniref:tRNA (adenosine(37)-N6)-dimethylallyltransferase MiaA n=1 Tax=Sphingobacterium shayense TaxID=626343 RepID=UPI001556667F|nr:tRNA (adenosine(37)-N6)-dimethylallyltransferase MiaA [Sphingobacterium shayense]NQD72387.1 tRNA (adenosine(37)-N6)-dimethylallyltransferase MiaA [Sphingobacterium shayense]